MENYFNSLPLAKSFFAVIQSIQILNVSLLPGIETEKLFK